MMTNDPEIQRQYQEAMINMRNDYPEDYKGPKAGGSSNEEWVAVTEFQAFKFIRDFTWQYSDFDCWLAARNNILLNPIYVGNRESKDECISHT